MDEKEFNCKVSALATPGALRKIYGRLWDEETPHAARVCRKSHGISQVTIYCDAENAAYFNTMVADENKTEI